MKKAVIILRGLPGSGKTTFSKNLRRHNYISMDLFWTRGGKPYKFDYTKIQDAVAWTETQFVNALNNPSTDLIVVDNVNYAKEHFRFFMEEAEGFGAMVHVVHVQRPVGELESTHNVPEDKIYQMRDKWEQIL